MKIKILGYLFVGLLCTACPKIFEKKPTYIQNREKAEKSKNECTDCPTYKK